MSVEAVQQLTEWAVDYKGQRILRYAFAPQMFKPYVKELSPLQGRNILLDAPADHLHHHALMYAVQVNDVNFWAETPGCGIQKVIRTDKPEITVNPQGFPETRLSQWIHWVTAPEAFLPDTAPVALMLEQRTLILTIDEANREVALHWRSEFQAGSKTNQVILRGANYFGLGLRFLRELDPVAKHENTGGIPDLSDNRQDASRHAWGSVVFDKPGQPASLVVFGHPSNARRDPWFFTMRTPFAYLSATQGLDREPLVYRSGDKFELNYLVTLRPGVQSRAAIEERHRRWIKSLPNRLAD
jgi:hypothetical protein